MESLYNPYDGYVLCPGVKLGSSSTIQSRNVNHECDTKHGNVFVSEVISKAAETAGIHIGDAVIKIAGKETRTMRSWEIASLINEYEGKTLEMEIIHAGTDDPKVYKLLVKQYMVTRWN